MEKWNKTNDRFIGFLDIMGFKDYVFRNSHNAVKKKMELFHNVIKDNESYIQSIGKKANKDTVIRTSIFSDAILVISESKNDKSLEALTAFCSSMFRNCIERGIPIKGAISCGKITADFEKSLFFGKALIDAYLLGEECFMYGIVADNKVEKLIKSHKTGFGDQFAYGKVPMKSGFINHYAVNWYSNRFPELAPIESIEAFYDTVAGRPRKYVDNTLDFANKYFVHKST